MFIKAGQVLSTREDLLPAEVTAQLEKLQDRTRPLPYRELVAGVELPPGLVVVDEAPLASASLGQVHRCTWRGRPAVVKFQKPGIRREISTTLWCVARFCQRFAAVSVNAAHLLDVCRQYRQALSLELDYVREAENLDRLARSLRGIDTWNRVPEVYYAGDLILVMECVQGVKISATEALAREGVDLPSLANALIQSFLHQVFVGRVYHGDGHAGNVAVNLDGAAPCLVWYDGGSVMTCGPELREELMTLSLAIARGRVDHAVACLQQMGITRSDRASRRAVGKLLRILLRSEPASVAELLGDEPELREALRTAFVTNSRYLLLGRSITVIDGICKTLDPTFNLIRRSMPTVQRLWGDDVDLVQEGGEFFRSLATLPQKISLIEAQLEQLQDESSVGAKETSAAAPLLAGQAVALITAFWVFMQ